MKVLDTAVYIVLGVDLEGQRDVLGHWVGDGAEGATFWLSVVSDLQARGVHDIFIACIDRGITRKWTAPMPNWAHIRNQLAIRFAGRFPM